VDVFVALEELIAGVLTQSQNPAAQRFCRWFTENYLAGAETKAFKG